MTMRWIAPLCVGLSLCATSVQAQLVMNPKTLTFTCSADHTATLADGTALLTRYDAEYYPAGAVAPLPVPTKVQNLAKPTGTNGGACAPTTVDKTGLADKTQYVIYVVAVGPGGSARSAAASNPFVWDVVRAPAAPALPIVRP
jgi:hypothetical protein